MKYIIIGALLLLFAFAALGQRDHQIILDPGMNVDTQYVMLSDTNSSSVHYGRGSWVKKSIAVPDNSPTNELQNLTIDSSGSADPRTFTIGIVGGNTIKLKDLAGAGVSDHGLLSGLGDDDHTQYPLLLGRAGGQTLIGGTGTTDDLIFRTTSGVGASGANMKFQVGNNGATEALTLLNSGFLGINNTAPETYLHIHGYNTTNSNIRTGTLEFQPFSMNNAFINENCYYSGGWKYRATGYAGMFYFYTGEGQFRFFASGSAGATLPGSGANTQFKVNANGDVALGGTISSSVTNYTGATLVAKAAGDVGIGTVSPSARLHLIKTTEQLRVGYNTSNYYSATVGSTGSVTFDATGAGAKFAFSDNLEAATNILPDANDGAVLGSSALSFSDLFLASGAVINFDNGDVTVTHAANSLTVAGGKGYFPGRVNIAGHTPANASDTGEAGDIAWDADYIYVCIAANTWKRVAIATW